MTDSLTIGRARLYSAQRSISGCSCLTVCLDPTKVTSKCICGASFSVEHSLSCAKGGFPSIRHNDICDLMATLLTEVCNDVWIEPELQPLTGEELTGVSAKTE